MPPSPPVIVWFREDLRLSDNPALQAACKTGQPLVLVYIHDDTSKDVRPLGGAARWWLHKSLEALAGKISKLGGTLTLRQGPAQDVMRRLVKETGASAVFWNRRYDKAGISIDTGLKAELKEAGISAETFNGRLLTEPWEIKNGSGQPYRVFSPYWKALRAAYSPPRLMAQPLSLAAPDLASDILDDWGLRPTRPDWASGFEPVWTPGEDGAQARLQHFIDDRIAQYRTLRDRPDLEATSGLSPHLRFGEISAHQVWRTIETARQASAIPEDDAMKFLSELAWREFSHVLLFNNPDLASENYNSDFGAMAWEHQPARFEKWCQGQTGYPIVDAGLRELWTTGWMHNRVRMITASFLAKHLMIPWQDGEAWFWDTLVDADPANNPAGWQWVAGCGADAAPYFRIFNPIAQGQKFDPDGNYVRKWCPELTRLPTKHIHAPWEADAGTLSAANVELGKTYPRPMVDHGAARQRALDAYKTLKENREPA